MIDYYVNGVPFMGEPCFYKLRVVQAGLDLDFVLDKTEKREINKNVEIFLKKVSNELMKLGLDGTFRFEPIEVKKRIIGYELIYRMKTKEGYRQNLFPLTLVRFPFEQGFKNYIDIVAEGNDFWRDLHEIHKIAYQRTQASDNHAFWINSRGYDVDGGRIPTLEEIKAAYDKDFSGSLNKFFGAI